MADGIGRSRAGYGGTRIVFLMPAGIQVDPSRNLSAHCMNQMDNQRTGQFGGNLMILAGSLLFRPVSQDFGAGARGRQPPQPNTKGNVSEVFPNVGKSCF